MKARDIRDHFLSRADWLHRTKTVDRIIVGDPERDVTRCLVAWMPSFEAIRTAVARGVELLVCHEPTFWDHWDDSPQNKPHCKEKLDYLLKTGLVILRNHDCWDRWPRIGIPWAWAQFLGFAGEPAAVAGSGYLHRYDIEPIRFEDFARRVAARTAAIGEPAVEVVGEPGQLVSKIGVGTGCGCDVFQYIEMGCDCSIVCDDGSYYWQHMQFAADRGHPVLCVNHATSEEPGMVTLTRYINENTAGVAAEHLPQGCRFRRVSAGS